MAERESGFIEEDEPLQEECGIVGLYLPSLDTPHAVRLALQAATGVQHRGQLGAGVYYPTYDGYRRVVRSGLMREVFTDSLVSSFTEDNPYGIYQVHARYGTNGGYNSTNFQPAVVPDRFTQSPISVIHNGQFTATEHLRRKIHELTGEEFPEDTSDTYLYAHYLAALDGDSMEEKILKSLDEDTGANGAYSMMIAYEDSLYLARDSFGIRPFVLGRIKDGWMAASETKSF